MSDEKPSMKALLDRKERLENTIRRVERFHPWDGRLYLGRSDDHSPEWLMDLSEKMKAFIISELKEELATVEAQLTAACHEFLQANHKQEAPNE